MKKIFQTCLIIVILIGMAIFALKGSQKDSDICPICNIELDKNNTPEILYDEAKEIYVYTYECKKCGHTQKKYI